MEIVSMKQQHTQILADLEKLCFSAPWSQTSLEDQVNNPRACFLTAVEGDQVLGYGGMHIAAGECYVDNIAVFHPCRGRGVGSAIIQALIDQAKKRDSAFLSLEVRPSNRAADQARTVVQSYSMQTAGSSGITQQSQAFLTLYSDHTFTFQIQMYDGYPTVDGEYEATESGYTLIPKSTTVQSLPLETLGEIRMEKEGEHLLYKGSQLNGIFSGAVFVPCILSDEN